MTTLDCVITGTGRCGTMYVAKLLNSVGMPCTHECIFRPDGWISAMGRLRKCSSLKPQKTKFHVDVDMENLRAEASFAAAPYVGKEELGDPLIVHLVRHPKLVVTSQVTFIHQFGNTTSPHALTKQFVYSFCPELTKEMPPFDRGALHYVLWNEMIERLAAGRKYVRHRIEDDDRILLSHIGVEPKEGMFNVKTENSYRNARPYRDLSEIGSDDIKNRLVAIGTRYGYEVDV